MKGKIEIDGFLRETTFTFLSCRLEFPYSPNDFEKESKSMSICYHFRSFLG